MFFRVEERTTVICFKEFQLHAIAIPLSDGCVRIFHVPHTQFFLQCTWLKFWSPAPDRIVGSSFLRVLEKRSISCVFHRTFVDPQLSPHVSTPLPTLAFGSSTSPSLSYPSMCPSTATLQGGVCFGRVAEQSPLTRVCTSMPNNQTQRKRQSRGSEQRRINRRSVERKL